MQFNQRGITISVDDEEIRRLVLERLTGDAPAHPASNAALYYAAMPRIGAEWPAAGGVFAGVCAGRDGAPDYFLIDGPEYDGQIEWQPSNDWAAGLKVGAFTDFTLPYRSEQAILFGNLKSRFREEAYWSREQHADYSSDAWGQYFGNGFQGTWGKDGKLRARAVRRLALNYLAI